VMRRPRHTDTYTQEIGSLRTSGSNRSLVGGELEAGPVLERLDRKGDRGLKTVELGLTALDGETSEEEVNAFFDSIASITVLKTAG